MFLQKLRKIKQQTNYEDKHRFGGAFFEAKNVAIQHRKHRERPIC